MKEAAGRVLITGGRSPGARHLALGLRAAGCVVHVADSIPTWCGARDRPAFVFHRLPPAAQAPADHAHAVVELSDTFGYTDIIPFNEDAVHLAQWGKGELGVRLRTPGFVQMRDAHDKAAFVRTCAGLGLGVPCTQMWEGRVGSDWPFAWRETVAKPVWSRFGGAAHVGLDWDALAQMEQAGGPWVLQERVHGEEVCLSALCHHGRVCGLVAYRPTHRAGRGAGVYLEPVDAAPFGEDVARFVAHTRWDGLVGFDAIVRDGRAVFIECNPRGTSGVHFWQDGQGLRAALRGRGVQAHGGALMVAPAMLAFGLPSAVRRGDVAGWRRDWGRAQDAMGVFAPPSVWAAASTTLALLWHNRWRGPLAASTADIVWEEGRGA